MDDKTRLNINDVESHTYVKVLNRYRNTKRILYVLLSFLPISLAIFSLLENLAIMLVIISLIGIPIALALIAYYMWWIRKSNLTGIEVLEYEIFSAYEQLLEANYERVLDRLRNVKTILHKPSGKFLSSTREEQLLAYINAVFREDNPENILKDTFSDVANTVIEEIDRLEERDISRIAGRTAPKKHESGNIQERVWGMRYSDQTLSKFIVPVSVVLSIIFVAVVIGVEIAGLLIGTITIILSYYDFHRG